MVLRGSRVGSNKSILAILDPNSAGPAFTITQPPSPSRNIQLALDLLAQDKHRRSDRECRSSFNLPKESYIHGGTSGEDEVSQSLQRHEKDC